MRSEHSPTHLHLVLHSIKGSRWEDAAPHAENPESLVSQLGTQPNRQEHLQRVGESGKRVSSLGYAVLQLGSSMRACCISQQLQVSCATNCNQT